MRARRFLTLIASMLLCFSLSAEQSKTYSWSSDTCQRCQSTIVYSNWYPDGSGLIGEGISGANTGALAALSIVKGNLVVSLGLTISHGPSFAINPREAVILETDSAPHMILYALEKPAPGFHKGDLPVLRQFSTNPLALTPNTPVAGFLFFPVDGNASSVTIVVTVGTEVFRFPFARDPSSRAKFGDPAKISSQSKAEHLATLSSHLPDVPPKQVIGVTKVGAPAASDLPTSHPASGHPENIPAARPATCMKNISFAVAEGGQVVTRAPRFTSKWIEKNSKKYPGLCFSQFPNAQAANFVVVFATSQSAFNGIYPAIRTTTSTSTTPVNGQGTLTDNYGGMWNYSYNGTVTSTATTTSQVNLPYRDTSTSIYAYSYDQSGRLVSQRQRTITTRQGGDGANTLGYNLGASLGAIHFRERLLKDAINDVTR